ADQYGAARDQCRERTEDALSERLGDGVRGAVLIGVFFVAAKRMRIEEINSMVGMVRGRLGR
ncbi:hypothetical protein, partial [Streptomyces alboniger]|uniref:hypothetical protein n=1 Tax=Streptomyces alboniger TaxID=132473 RepID=UPI000A688D4A